MNAIKNAMVVVILLGVGYGAHVVLNRPMIDETGLGESAMPLPDTLVDMNQARATRPDIDLGTPSDSVQISGVPNYSNSDALGPSGVDVAYDENQLPGDLSGSATASPDDSLSAVESQSETSTSPVAPPADHGVSNSETPSANSVSGENPTSEPPKLDSVWQSVKASLAQNDMANALFTLSSATSDPQTTNQQRSEMQPLMDQLAGTVIYSREHLMEPPYVVTDGESLVDIAAKYQVPAELLARINGIEEPFTLVSGETLKVVTGPFRAEVSVANSELTLYLGRYYAGRFPLQVGANVPAAEVTLTVVEKTDKHDFTDAVTGQTLSAGDPNNPYGHHWLGLADSDSNAPANWAIHGRGEACPDDDRRGSLGLSSGDADDVHAILTIGSSVRVIR